MAPSRPAPAPYHPIVPVLLEPWEAAVYLGLTEDGLSRLIRDGVIPVCKLGGRPRSRVRIRKSDLDALISASLTPATSGPLAK